MKVTRRCRETKSYEKYYLKYYNEALKIKGFLNCVDKFEAIREKNRLMKLPHIKGVVLFEIG